jgi:nucleoside-diphosphate-sugar epimerase
MAVKDEPLWGTMPDRVWDTEVWVADSRKIRSDLKWETRVDFREGFLRMLNWLAENPEMLKYYTHKAEPIS